MIEALRGRPGAETALKRLGRRRSPALLTPHVGFDLHRGVVDTPRGARETSRIERLGPFCSMLPFDRSAARLAARMARALKDEGHPIALLDIFIAASAIACGDGEIINRDTDHLGRLTRFGLVVTRPDVARLGGPPS